MPLLDPSISSLDAAVKFGLELGHDLHAIEIVAGEILEEGGGTTTTIEDEKGSKPAHNRFERQCHDDDYLSYKLVSDDDASLQTSGLTVEDTILSNLQPDSAQTVNLDNYMCNRSVRTFARHKTEFIIILLIVVFLTLPPKLQSTAMELHRRIESLEVQLETKEQELVACKNDLTRLQRSHMELVASNDKLLELYEKTKSKR